MDRSHGRVQVHEKIIQALALTTLPDNTYDDDNNGGPLKPGFQFYKWLMLGPPLQLHIAETYLCHRRGGVTCLRTDPMTGYIIKHTHPLTSESQPLDNHNHATLSNDPINDSDVDMDFVRACLDRVVYQSTPLISLPAIYNLPLPIQTTSLGDQNNLTGGIHNARGGINHTMRVQSQAQGQARGPVAVRMLSRSATECIDTPDDSPGSYMYPTHHEKLLHRFVAVVKRPIATSSGLVANDVELLQPLGFQAHLLNAIYGRTTNQSSSSGGGDGGDVAGPSFASSSRDKDPLAPITVLQRYIKPRGRKAGLYRVFWKKLANRGDGVCTAWHIENTGGSGFRVYDGGGGEDDPMSGLIGTDRDRAQSNDRHAQSNDRHAQSNDRARAQSNDRARAQSNHRRESDEMTPESERGFETGIGLKTGLNTGFKSGVGTGKDVGMGLDVFGRLANTSTTHIHRSLPSKVQTKHIPSHRRMDSLIRPLTRSKQMDGWKVPDHRGEEDVDDVVYGENEYKEGGDGDGDGGTGGWGTGSGGARGGGTGGTNESRGVTYLANEDDMCVRWMDQHTLLTATERHVAIAASTKAHWESGASCICSLTHTTNTKHIHHDHQNHDSANHTTAAMPVGTTDGMGVVSNKGGVGVSNKGVGISNKGIGISNKSTKAQGIRGNLNGRVTPESCAKITATKVISTAAMATLKSYCDRLVQWIQATVYAVEDLRLILSELVVDFVLTEDHGQGQGLRHNQGSNHGQWMFLQVKGFQVTEDTLPIVKYYHQHRLLKHTHHHHHQQQQQQRQIDDDDDDDHQGKNKDKGKARSQQHPKTTSLAMGGKNKEKFYYTPHLTDQELRARLAGQVAVCCDMCGRGFHTDKDVVLVETSPSFTTTATTNATATSIPSPATSSSSAAVTPAVPVSAFSDMEPTTTGLETTNRSEIRFDTGTRASIKNRASTGNKASTGTRASTGTKARSAEYEVSALATMLQYHASQPLHTRTHRPSNTLVQNSIFPSSMTNTSHTVNANTTLPNKPSKPLPSSSSSSSSSLPPPQPSSLPPSTHDVKEVLAYGYLISKHTAGQLAQWYRDRGFPLTTLSHELLANQAKIAAQAVVAIGCGTGTNAEGTSNTSAVAGRSTKPMNTSSEPLPVVLLIPPTDLHESVKICYYCTQVLQQIDQYHTALSALHTLLDNSIKSTNNSNNNNNNNSNNNAHNIAPKTITSSPSSSLFSNSPLRPRSAPTSTRTRTPTHSTQSLSPHNPLLGPQALTSTAFPPFIVPPQSQTTVTDHDAWLLVTQMKARWLTTLVLKASSLNRSLTRSLAAKSIHPLPSSPLTHTHFDPENSFANPFSTSTHRYPSEAFPLVDTPDRLAQSNTNHLSQSNDAPDRLTQSNGKINDILSLARLLSSNNSHILTTNVSSTSDRCAAEEFTQGVSHWRVLVAMHHLVYSVPRSHTHSSSSSSSSSPSSSPLNQRHPSSSSSSPMRQRQRGRGHEQKHSSSRPSQGHQPKPSQSLSVFLHSCGVTPYAINNYNNDDDDVGDGGGNGDDGDDCDNDAYHDVDDMNDQMNDEGPGLGVGFELGLGLGLGVDWGGAGGVGCVCYDMGQRHVAMCFAVEGTKKKGVDKGGNNKGGVGGKGNDEKVKSSVKSAVKSGGAVFPVHQCRVHTLVGTPTDVRTHFSHMAQSNDLSPSQSNSSPEGQSNSSPEVQSNGLHAQSNSSPAAQSNGMGAAPGDLHLTILYSPNPEPSSSKETHRPPRTEMSGWKRSETEPALMCLGYAVVPLNQYVMKWSLEGTSLRSGMTKCDITVPVLHHQNTPSPYNMNSTNSHQHQDHLSTTASWSESTKEIPTGLYVKVTVALVRDDPLPQVSFSSPNLIFRNFDTTKINHPHPCCIPDNTLDLMLDLFHIHEHPPPREISREQGLVDHKPRLSRPITAHGSETRASGSQTRASGQGTKTNHNNKTTTRATFCYETSQDPRPTQFIDRYPSKVFVRETHTSHSSNNNNHHHNNHSNHSASSCTVYWPPPHYHPYLPLPEVWLGMLTPTTPTTITTTTTAATTTDKATSLLQHQQQQQRVSMAKHSANNNNNNNNNIHPLQPFGTSHSFLSPYEQDVIWAYQQALTTHVFQRMYPQHDPAKRQDLGDEKKDLGPLETFPLIQILFQSLRALKHHLIEQRQSEQQQQQQQQQQQKENEEHNVEENDDQRWSSWNQPITAIEHCTIAIETLLLQDKLPAVVSSLKHFQEWLLKSPEEEVYQDPYAHLCTDSDDEDN